MDKEIKHFITPACFSAYVNEEEQNLAIRKYRNDIQTKK